MQDIEATFANYQLHDVLSRDAVSTVYRATTASWDPARPGGPRTVALRISEPLTSDDDRRQARVFERRATAATDINHPGIARVLDVGTSGDRVYMATAWRDSVTLDELLDRAWQLAPDEAVDLLHVLAEGLDAAHDAGLVHGAMTTRTIRVDRGDDGTHRAFLTGFGVDALLARRLGSKRQRDNGGALDDLLYVAPEQLRGDMLDPATDQYALACALYHCVSGQPPFVRDTASALFGAHLFARPPVTGALADESSSSLRDALATGLAKHPQDRHGSCARLLRAAGNGDATAAVMPTTFGPTAAARRASNNGIGERVSAGVAATGATLGRARNGLASRTRSGRRSLGEMLRTAQTPTLAVAAVVSGAILALLIFLLLQGGDPAPTAEAGDEAAANAVAEQPPDAADAANAAAAAEEAPDAEAAPEAAAEPPPTAVVEWEQPVASTAVTSVTAEGDTVLAAAEGDLAALDRDSGEVRWQQAVEDGTVTSTAVIDDVYAYRSSKLHALALADGRPRWSKDDQYTPAENLAAVPGGPLYGTGPGNNMPELTAIDAGTGEELWHFHHSGDIHVMPNAGVAAGDDLVAVAQRGSLFAVDPDGDIITTSLGRREIAGARWRIDITRPWPGSVTLLSDAVVVATRDGKVCNYAKRDGAQRWCQQVDGVTDRAPTLLPQDDAVVVATRATLVALDRRTGAPQWEAPADAPISVAAHHGDTIVTGDTAGTLRGVAVGSGEQRWEMPGGAPVTAVAVDAAGVYAGARDGTVRRVQPQEG